jgi:hypothetical protein
VTQNRNGHLVGHVIDVGDAVEDHNKRITQTSAELCFHTDSCDVVTLLCVNRALTGGESMIVSGISVHDELLRRRPDLLAELYKPIYMDRRGEVPPGKKPWFGMPLFSWHRGLFTRLLAGAPVHRFARALADAPRMSNTARNLDYAICGEDAFCAG